MLLFISSFEYFFWEKNKKKDTTRTKKFFGQFFKCICETFTQIKITCFFYCETAHYINPCIVAFYVSRGLIKHPERNIHKNNFMKWIFSLPPIIIDNPFFLNSITFSLLLFPSFLWFWSVNCKQLKKDLSKIVIHLNSNLLWSNKELGVKNWLDYRCVCSLMNEKNIYKWIPTFFYCSYFISVEFFLFFFI